MGTEKLFGTFLDDRNNHSSDGLNNLAGNRVKAVLQSGRIDKSLTLGGSL